LGNRSQKRGFWNQVMTKVLGDHLVPDRILKLGYAFRGSMVLMSAIELDVFTTLGSNSIGLDALSRKVGIAHRGAADFLDCLVALGLLERDSDQRYTSVPDCRRFLDRSTPDYVGDELLHAMVRIYLRWMSLTAALRTGEPQSEATRGGLYPGLYATPAAIGTFARAMSGGNIQAARTIASRALWNKVGSVVDVGASRGSLLVEVLKRYQHLVGIGFDLPALRGEFERYVQEHALSHRLVFQAGDFLADRLPAADAMVMGRILHNWDLPTKRLLLRKAHEALSTNGRLIILERMIDDDRTEATGLLASLNMLIMTPGGFDFSPKQCIGWMEDTGFAQMHVEPLPGLMSMVTGIKR
jgi:SAM-dependent methyltransferase